jgi:hypothetical protein
MKIQVTLIGEARHCYKLPVIPGNIVKLSKDFNNCLDNESIAVYCDWKEGELISEITDLGNLKTRCGYVCNGDKANGTFSAGRLYDKMDNEIYAKILYIKENCIIAEVELPYN